MMAEYNDVYAVDAFTKIAMLEDENLRLKQQLKEYQDKIEQGTLIDTEERFIVEDELWGSKNRFLICKHHIGTLIEDFCFTREEAEKRLKELQNGDNN